MTHEVDRNRIVADGRRRILAGAHYQATSHALRHKIQRRCAPLLARSSLVGRIVIHFRAYRYVRRRLRKLAPPEALYSHTPGSVAAVTSNLFSLVLLLATAALAADPPSLTDGHQPILPAASSSTAQILDSFKTQRGYGEPFSVLLRDGDRYLFITWNCPFSGLDVNLVFAYYYDGSVWHQFYTGSVRAVPPRVSPTLDSTTHEVVLHGRSDSTSVRVPLSNIPGASTAPKT